MLKLSATIYRLSNQVRSDTISVMSSDYEQEAEHLKKQIKDAEDKLERANKIKAAKEAVDSREKAKKQELDALCNSLYKLRCSDGWQPYRTTLWFITFVSINLAALLMISGAHGIPLWYLVFLGVQLVASLLTLELSDADSKYPFYENIRKGVPFSFYDACRGWYFFSAMLILFSIFLIGCVLLLWLFQSIDRYWPKFYDWLSNW